MLKKTPHTQLTDVHKEILVKHYDEARVSSVDQIPVPTRVESVLERDRTNLRGAPRRNACSKDKKNPKPVM